MLDFHWRDETFRFYDQAGFYAPGDFVLFAPDAIIGRVAEIARDSAGTVAIVAEDLTGPVALVANDPHFFS